MPNLDQVGGDKMLPRIDEALRRFQWDLSYIRKRGPVHGPVLYRVQMGLLRLKYVSPCYWVNYSYRSVRPFAVDVYCMAQTIALLLCLLVGPYAISICLPAFGGWILYPIAILAIYPLLFDMFLNYANVLFLGREHINHGIQNAERSLVLLCLSLASLVFGFGTFYRFWCRFDRFDGFSAALYSLGTMEIPDKLAKECELAGAEWLPLTQIPFNIFLLVVFVALIVGQFKLKEP
jgi:hypothetical protein